MFFRLRNFAHTFVLLALLAAEIIIFSSIGENFFSIPSAFEIARHNVEIGLLAIALTPVIVSGGIDLSVGSLMALCAVILGRLWRDYHVPLPAAVGLTLCLGAAAGTFNGLFITRLRIPPLIVTLGSMSLFQGIAEGLMSGVAPYSHFDPWFNDVGNRFLFNETVPEQLFILIAVAIGFWFLLHRTTIGRSLFAIGFSPDGARYAGIPVQRRLMLVYILSGLLASLASLVYVARQGEAGSGSGKGSELLAITAVVLGGTSIFGGRGTIIGTLMGLFAIGILQTGLQLAGQPAQLGGVLTGIILIFAMTANQLLTKLGSMTMKSMKPTTPISLTTPTTLLSFMLIALFATLGLGCDKPKSGAAGGGSGGTGGASGKKITIAVMPKSMGNEYFIDCQKGAQQAADELKDSVILLWNGPTGTDAAAEQNQMIDTWIIRGVDVIAVAVQKQDAISTALRRAKAKGIKVLTWDADAEADARDFFVNQATPDGIAKALCDNAAAAMDKKGDFALIMGDRNAGNMKAWDAAIKTYMAATYPDIKRVAEDACNDDAGLAKSQADAIIRANPSVKLIMAICSPAVPASAEAIKQAGKDVKVVGLGLPNANKPYVHSGITQAVILWNTQNLGYLTVHAAKALFEGKLKPGDTTFEAARLSKLEVKGDNILLGTPLRFDKGNIDTFNF